MLKSIQQRDLDRNRWIKITMTVILVVICVSMVVTLVPGLVGGAVGTSNPDTIASVAGQDISLTEVERQLNQMTQNQSVPAMLKGLYAHQLLDQMVFQDALNVEAARLGITVTPEEESAAHPRDPAERLGRRRLAEGRLHQRRAGRHRDVGGSV